MALGRVESAVADESRRRARRVSLAVGIVFAVIALLIVGWVAGRAYFRVDLFGEYQAGYASVSPSAISDEGVACNTAVQAAFPNLDLAVLPKWPDEPGAFWQGCADRRGGRRSDPWNLHNNLHDSD